MIINYCGMLVVILLLLLLHLVERSITQTYVLANVCVYVYIHVFAMLWSWVNHILVTY